MRASTSLFDTLSDHLMSRISRKHRIWKVLKSPLLSGVQSPRLAAIQQGTENAGPVDGGFGVQSQLAVFPYTP